MAQQGARVGALPWPADVALPSAPSSGGLPIRFQLVGAFGSDLQLLAAARAWEERKPWAQRWPRLAG